MGFRGSNGTSHKVKRFKSNWKSDYIIQRKKDAKNPDLQAFRYNCSAGHIRIEKKKLDEKMLQCPACEKNGKINRFKFVGKYTIPRSQVKKSRFK